MVFRYNFYLRHILIWVRFFVLSKMLKNFVNIIVKLRGERPPPLANFLN